jgi:hypothetical protein
MKIYLDDDSAAALLVRLLARDGHDVVTPADLGTAGQTDPVHFTTAIRHGRTFLTANHDDFLQLHQLVIVSGGHHPGVFIVRKDNNPLRDMKARDIVRSIRNLINSGLPITDEFHILNHWR